MRQECELRLSLGFSLSFWGSASAGRPEAQWQRLHVQQHLTEGVQTTDRIRTRPRRSCCRRPRRSRTRGYHRYRRRLRGRRVHAAARAPAARSDWEWQGEHVVPLQVQAIALRIRLCLRVAAAFRVAAAAERHAGVSCWCRCRCRCRRASMRPSQRQRQDRVCDEPRVVLFRCVDVRGGRLRLAIVGQQLLALPHPREAQVAHALRTLSPELPVELRAHLSPDAEQRFSEATCRQKTNSAIRSNSLLWWEPILHVLHSKTRSSQYTACTPT